MSGKTETIIKKDQQQQQRRTATDDDENTDIEATEQSQKLTFYDRVNDMVERFATTSLGQFVIVRSDRALKTIEDTAKWSLPHEKSQVPLERPLPWIPFLVMIIVLRLLRIWLSFGALLIGNEPVRPQDMIYFIQTRRRKLRAIRVNGLKAIRRREQEQELNQESVKDSTTNNSLKFKLHKLFSRAICRPGQQHEVNRHVFIYRGNVCEDKLQLETQASKRPRDDDDSQNANLTTDQLLDNYANDTSKDDSDFVPHAETESDENDSELTSSDNDDLTMIKSNNEKKMANKGERGDHKNESVEILENGVVHRPMPKPMIDIKNEPISDTESGNQQTPNGPRNGETAEQHEQPADVARIAKSAPNPLRSKLNMSRDDEKKATPGHESAAAVNTRLFNSSTTAAGSPTSFNASFLPPSILKNSSNLATNVNAHSTPTSECDDTNEVSVAPPKKHVQHQEPPKHQNQYHNRYRGRNRR